MAGHKTFTLQIVASTVQSVASTVQIMASTVQIVASTVQIVASTVQIVNKLKRLDTFVWTPPAPSIFQIGLKTQNHVMQFYIGPNVTYSFNDPIFKEINITERHYVSMLPVYI
jgi:hypothetical protein